MQDTPNCNLDGIGDGWKPSIFRRVYNQISRWVFLNIWCSWLYRPTMKILHYFNIHYTPPLQIYNGELQKHGKKDHWCQWCGLRGSTWILDHTTLFLKHKEPTNTQSNTKEKDDLLDWAEEIICNSHPMHCSEKEWSGIIRRWRDEKHRVEKV